MYPDSQSYHCFGCGISGDIFKFLMMEKNILFPEALKILAREAGLEYNFVTSPPTNKRQSNKVKHNTNSHPIHKVHNESLLLLPDSAFSEWFHSIAGTIQPLRYFDVGAYDLHSTVFWYRDIKNNLVNGKVVKYAPDGHRDKDKPPHFIYKKEDGYGQCLYGEFQLKTYDFTAPIILVESEKTAIWGYHLKPEYVWLATGGVNGLTEEKAKILSGRYVFICVDADKSARDDVERTLAVLTNAGAKPETKDFFQNRSDGFDLADWIVEYLSI